MRNLITSTLIITLLATSTLSHAGMYKCMVNGSTTYQQIPCSNPVQIKTIKKDGFSVTKKDININNEAQLRDEKMVAVMSLQRGIRDQVNECRQGQNFKKLDMDREVKVLNKRIVDLKKSQKDVDKKYSHEYTVKQFSDSLKVRSNVKKKISKINRKIRSIKNDISKLELCEKRNEKALRQADQLSID